ncbi:MAG TPA: hypothetical protein VGF20_15230 [Candidatus Acidoferrum sp.]
MPGCTAARTRAAATARYCWWMRRRWARSSWRGVSQRPGLQAEMQGRRGLLCRALTGGTLQRGDVIIELQEKTLTAENSSAD